MKFTSGKSLNPAHRGSDKKKLNAQFPHLYKRSSVNALPSLRVYSFPFAEGKGVAAVGRRGIFALSPLHRLCEMFFFIDKGHVCEVI
jgi:hypothetical protein